MKTFKKRIAFVISAQHLIPHGGIGQYAKGFLEMSASMNYAVDLILDKPLNSKFLDDISKDVARVYHPTDTRSYSQHTKTFAFSDSYNIEKMANFRDAMMVALQENLYDMILVNTPEAIVPIYGLGIQGIIPIVFYTHNENLVFTENKFKGVFNSSFDEFFLSILQAKDVIIGTQSSRNLEELKRNGYDNSVWMQMPIPERGLLDVYEGSQEGVLFIGRWEERKQPKEFCRIIKETGLPARIMTNENGRKKFTKELGDCKDVDIRVQIIGQDKVDFIKSCRVHYMPSRSESFGFAFAETLGHMPTFALKDYEWPDNFKGANYLITTKKNACKDILEAYNGEVRGDINYIKALDDQAKTHLSELLSSKTPLGAQSSRSNISKKDNFYYSEHVSDLGRFASIEDSISAMNYAKEINVIYTEDGTWFSSTGESPKDTDENEGLYGYFE